MSINRKILIISIILSLAVGFSGGIWFKQTDSSSSISTVKKLVSLDNGKPNNVDFSLFWEVYSVLNSKFVDKNKIDPQKILYGAISGMVNSVMDPYTVFLEPDNSKKFQEEIAGSFGGVGIEIGKRNGVITVIAPIKNSPASRAGIKAGDKIIKVNSKPTTNMAIEEAINLIRGKKGTKVVLTISPNSGDNTKDIQLTREIIKIPTIEWQLINTGNHQVAYIQIFSFNENVDSEFKKASEEILKSKADRLIIDLRNNPGGLLDSAINLAGWFLDKNQLIVSEDFGNGTKNEFRSDGNGALNSYPTLVLINGGSASASEILSGALRDNKGIKLVGEKSFGKGSVQELQKFNDGSSLKVTIAKWLTPNGIFISEKGIEPDIKIEISDKNKESGDIEIGTPGKDPQLDKALDLFK